MSANYKFEVLADPRLNSQWTIEHRAEYRNLTDGTVHPTLALWRHFYGGRDRVIFSTCIAAADGSNPGWGRMYVCCDRDE